MNLSVFIWTGQR